MVNAVRVLADLVMALPAPTPRPRARVPAPMGISGTPVTCQLLVPPSEEGSRLEDSAGGGPRAERAYPRGWRRIKDRLVRYVLDQHPRGPGYAEGDRRRVSSRSAVDPGGTGSACSVHGRPNNFSDGSMNYSKKEWVPLEWMEGRRTTLHLMDVGGVAEQ